MIALRALPVSFLVLAAAAAASELDVSRAVLDFGQQAYVSRPRTFVVTNVGDTPWRVAPIVPEGRDAAVFSIASRDCPPGSVVPPGARCVFESVFLPHGTGDRSATVRVAPDHAITLRGTAATRRTDGIGPLLLIFTRGIDLAFPLSETIEVSNAGDEPLHITALRIDGREPAEFEIASACPLPATLQPAQGCWITVSMTGLGTAPWSAELVVESAELGRYRLGVTGYQPPLVDPLVP